ncbi:MAG: hypothetical protein ABW104_01720 [Candidatus Thiodiazotropha sp. 6PLUC2]
MTQLLHTGRLVLTPKNPYQLPENPEAIFSRLQEIGLIDTPLQTGHSYLPGEAFMQLITFMGCSPSIRLAPDDSDQPFCHLLLDGPYPRPKLIVGKNTLPPRCERCRKRLGDWQNTFKIWEAKGDGWQSECPHCGHLQDPATYDFKQSAGCGRFLLYLENIFPQEAIPAQSLLDSLKHSSKEEIWHFFYHQELVKTGFTKP